jgi:AcrR family transcriptional regulator
MATARGSLNERRRAVTQMEIAHAAAELFAERGLVATTVEQIASRAGVGLRTFYRYFPSKQDAVVPLFARGAEDWRDQVATITGGSALRESVADVIASSLTPTDGKGLADLELTRGLIRSVATDRDLQRVWYDVNGDSERHLTSVFAALAPSADPVVHHLLAAATTDAVRLALEMWALPNAPDEPGPADLARDCFLRLTEWYAASD